MYTPTRPGLGLTVHVNLGTGARLSRIALVRLGAKFAGCPIPSYSARAAVVGLSHRHCRRREALERSRRHSAHPERTIRAQLEKRPSPTLSMRARLFGHGDVACAADGGPANEVRVHLKEDVIL